MPDISKIDYSNLDRPEIIAFLFHPRPEYRESGPAGSGEDVSVSVEKDVVIGARFHMAEKSAPNILFFHGNGEIVGDYDEMGPLYNRLGINFLPVDYRGYGRSTGSPSITFMMRDCHVIFEFVRKWLNENAYAGELILMGRSLGSASVLELAAHYRDGIGALIVESGFARTGPLLELLGVNLSSLGFEEEIGLRNIDKIRDFDRPTLIIHAERDHLIPFSEGQALYDACGAPDKTLLKIPGANHNDIFTRGLSEYLAAVMALAEKTRG
jgi:pimeloyl-ACP methyl ester carboxylesterase